MSAARKLNLNPEEYLNFERKAEERHEYYAGEIYSMAGTSSRHNRITGKMYAALLRALSGTGCEPFISDLRTKVDYGYKYPDIVIACDPKFEDKEFDTLLNPIVIIEILSPSTECFDRTTKFDRYRSIPSLREYFLIAQSHPRIERFSWIDNPNVASAQTLWAYQAWVGLESQITLNSVQCTIEAAEIYQNVEFDEPEDWSEFERGRRN